MILVTYATTHGSTEEVAAAVAEELRGKGLEVETVNVKDVRSLETYDSVVLGAPLFMFKLHGHARKFLSKQENALKQMGEGDVRDWDAIHSWAAGLPSVLNRSSG